MSSSANDKPSSKKLTPQKIPGSYGLPFIGPIKDRYDYFYNQGREEFFKSRVEKYNSTVFRVNMPPGPFVAKDSRVITVLDAASFPILFDNSKIEKKDVFDGTFMPSTKFTGGYRVCSFLDTTEPSHAALKGLFLSQLTKLHDNFIPTFHSSMSDLFPKIEDELSKKGQADFNSLSDEASFDFVFRLFCEGTRPSDTNIGSSGTTSLDKWLVFQLAPLITLGLKFLPNFIEDLVLHTFPLPFLPVKSDYKKIYNGFSKYATSFLDAAEKSGIKRDEACHNLVFLGGFNTYGGLKVLFPALLKWVGDAGQDLQTQLADEIRPIVQEEGGVTLSGVNRMSLTKSVAYETLRIEPPVPFQYGKAREDLVISNHEASFQIKKGEMIFGYQPYATKDPKIFSDPDEFVPDRFVGDGEKLIQYVFWSNGKETDTPTVNDKQCPGKDLIVLLARLILVEIFLRYDSFTVEYTPFLLGEKVTIKSLTKATT